MLYRVHRDFYYKCLHSLVEHGHIIIVLFYDNDYMFSKGCRGRNRMVVGFTTTCAINVYHH
jgi:hypothetical protein